MSDFYIDFDFIEPGYSPENFDFNFGTMVYYSYVLKGNSNNFSSIWVYNNKMYVGSEGYFNVVNLEDNSLYDCYGEVIIGRANEPLDNSAIVDINVS